MATVTMTTTTTGFLPLEKEQVSVGKAFTTEHVRELSGENQVSELDDPVQELDTAGEINPSKEEEEDVDLDDRMQEIEGGARAHENDPCQDDDDDDDDALSDAVMTMVLQAALRQAMCGAGGEAPKEISTNSENGSTNMFTTVLEYLGGRNYELMPPEVEGRRVITMNLTGTHATYRTFIDVRIPDDRMTVLVVSPVKVPFHRRASVIEFLMRANFTMALGNLELDMSDGEVRVRLAVDVEGSHLSTKMAETNIMVAASTMDRFFPSMMKVVYDETNSPAEAVQEVI